MSDAEKIGRTLPTSPPSAGDTPAAEMPTLVRPSAPAPTGLRPSLGFDQGDHVASDADLAPLHDDPRWKELLGRMGKPK